MKEWANFARTQKPLLLLLKLYWLWGYLRNERKMREEYFLLTLSFLIPNFNCTIMGCTDYPERKKSKFLSKFKIIQWNISSFNFTGCTPSTLLFLAPHCSSSFHTALPHSTLLCFHSHFLFLHFISFFLLSLDLQRPWCNVNKPW